MLGLLYFKATSKLEEFLILEVPYKKFLIYNNNKHFNCKSRKVLQLNS